MIRPTALSIRFCVWLCLGACVVFSSAPARAQDSAEKRALAYKYAQQASDALDAGDYPKSEELLRRQLALQPHNFVVYYNLACCRALQDDPKGAGELLRQAVDHGFSARRHMERDPQLANVRDDPNYVWIRDNWPAILRTQAQTNLADARTLFSKGYTESRDERLKVIYLSAFNPTSFEAAKGEMTRIAEWADARLFPGLFDAEAGRDDAWVVVVLPSKADFTKWATLTYGSDAVQGMSMIAGSYQHDEKRLVAMDLGATLRHEFLHLLHWRHLTRAGVAHPIWVLEGLGALVEDYDLGADGKIIPAPSWRTNTAKRIEKIGKLMPIETLSRLNHATFSGQRPLANYAQARAFFLYLSSRDKLADWYADYTSNYRDDPTGVAATERVLGKPVAEINQDFRAFVRALPAVAEEIKPGMASLGFEVDTGTGEGPVITSLPRGRNGAPAPLRLGDVLTAIDDKPVRDIAELVRVLSQYKPGDTVRAAYRRGKLHGEATVLLEKR